MARDSAVSVECPPSSRGSNAMNTADGAGGADSALPDCAKALVAQQQRTLTAVTSLDDLRRWRDELVDQLRHQRSEFYAVVGCMLAGLTDDTRRTGSATFFDQWHLMIAGALQRLQTQRTLAASADAPALATGLLAAVQGGYLLGRVFRDPGQMESALDTALDHLDNHAVEKS